MSVNLSFRAPRLVMFPFRRFVRLLPSSLQWVPWPRWRGKGLQKSYVSTRYCYLGSHTPGRAQGVTPEEPTAGNPHGGVREGGDPRRAMVDLSGHEAGNGGYSQRKPTAHRDSSTRNVALSPDFDSYRFGAKSETLFPDDSV